MAKRSLLSRCPSYKPSNHNGISLPNEELTGPCSVNAAESHTHLTVFCNQLTSPVISTMDHNLFHGAGVKLQQQLQMLQQSLKV